MPLHIFPPNVQSLATLYFYQNRLFISCGGGADKAICRQANFILAFCLNSAVLCKEVNLTICFFNLTSGYSNFSIYVSNETLKDLCTLQMRYCTLKMFNLIISIFYIKHTHLGMHCQVNPSGHTQEIYRHLSLTPKVFFKDQK